MARGETHRASTGQAENSNTPMGRNVPEPKHRGEKGHAVG